MNKNTTMKAILVATSIIGLIQSVEASQELKDAETQTQDIFFREQGATSHSEDVAHI